MQTIKAFCADYEKSGLAMSSVYPSLMSPTTGGWSTLAYICDAAQMLWPTHGQDGERVRTKDQILLSRPDE